MQGKPTGHRRGVSRPAAISINRSPWDVMPRGCHVAFHFMDFHGATQDWNNQVTWLKPVKEIRNHPQNHQEWYKTFNMGWLIIVLHALCICDLWIICGHFRHMKLLTWENTAIYLNSITLCCPCCLSAYLRTQRTYELLISLQFHSYPLQKLLPASRILKC